MRGIQYNTNEAIDDFVPSYTIEDARQSSAGESVIVYTTYMKRKKKNVYTLKYACILMPPVYLYNIIIERSRLCRGTAPPSAYYNNLIRCNIIIIAATR